MTLTIAQFENSQTVSTTELSIPSAGSYSAGTPRTEPGIWQLFIDLSAMAAGDIFRLNVYGTIRTSGGTQRKVYSKDFVGAQRLPIWAGPSAILGIGWDMTLTKIAGTDRVIPARLARIDIGAATIDASYITIDSPSYRIDST